MKTEVEKNKKNRNSINHSSLMSQLDDLYKRSQKVRHQIEVQKEERLNGHA